MDIRAMVLLGAPGAGKGTVAEALKAATGYGHLSTGDLLRDAIRGRTPIGVQAAAFMKRGELVPDPLILALVTEYFDRAGNGRGYMLDGFPRTLAQATRLDDQLNSRRARLEVVFLLEVSEAVIVDRLTGRRLCRNCGANFHIRNIPPKVAGRCDHCGGELYQRPDDQADTIRKRLEVYRRQTADLIAYYADRQLLQRIDSDRPRDETVADILRRLRVLDPQVGARS